MSGLLQSWTTLLHSLAPKALGLTVWLAALGLTFGALERWRPIRRRQQARRGWAQDIAYFYLGGLLQPFVTVLATVAVIGCTAGLVPVGAGAWVAGLPLALRVVAMLVLGDVAFYWAHRWAHECEALWRLHATHHSPTEMDWLVNTRAHLLDLVFARVVSSLPALALGLHQPAADLQAVTAIVLTMTTVWAFVIHANVDWRMGWLEQLIVTPAFHHWHHANDTEAARNKNYAALFPWLDRLFGTYHMPKDRFPSSYGANAASIAT